MKERTLSKHLSSTVSRRAFLGRSLAATAIVAANTGGMATADESSSESSHQWIDAHVHVWSPDTEKYPLSPNFDASHMQPTSFTAEELFSHCRPAGVGRIVLIQMSFYEYDHTYMLEVMQAHPGVFSGVALIDYRSPTLSERFHELVKQGMRGFRLHARATASEWVDDPGMAKLWRMAGENGLAICPLINPSDIPYVHALCEKFPETTVVVDHFARVGIDGRMPAEQLDALCGLARFPNTHLKTSAFYALGNKKPPYDDLLPMLKRVTQCYGPQRLMWASDGPFQVQGEHTYEASIALIRDRADFLTASDKQWMLKGTAEKVFFR